MTKNQKILLWVSIALFIVPEVIWSPVSNYLFSYVNGHPYRDTLVIYSDNRSITMFIVFLQIVGSMSFTTILIKDGKYKLLKFGTLIVFLGTLLTLLGMLVLFPLYATKSIG